MSICLCVKFAIFLHILMLFSLLFYCYDCLVCPRIGFRRVCNNCLHSHHCKLHHCKAITQNKMAATLSEPDHIQAMPGITSQLQRGGNVRLTNACLMSVLSVYLQMLIIRTQIGTHLVNCVQISCHIRSSYNASSASSPLEHFSWGKHHLSAQGTPSSCQWRWRCGGSQHACPQHHSTFVQIKLVYGAQVRGGEVNPAVTSNYSNPIIMNHLTRQ